MNRLENQLRSWRPRRPLPSVKRKLFGAAGEASGLSFRWLGPALACLVLALTIASQEPGLSAAASAHQEPMMGLVSSNLSLTNILPEGRNGILPVSFEWTNLSGFTSSISPFSPSRLN